MKKISIGIALLLAAFSGGRAGALETYYDAGTDALPLQYAGGTARATGMGSAVVAVPQGSGSLLWNPAGLARMECTEVGLHHYSGLSGIAQETAIVGVPLGPVKDDCKGGALGGLAASLNYVDYGTFNGRDVTGLPTGNYHARDYSASLGWGIEILPSLSGGIAVKGNQSKLLDKNYYAYAADLGVLLAVSKSLDLGITYSNINLNSNIGGLAAGWRLGAAWTLDRHLVLALAGELQNNSMSRLQFGTEYLIGNVDGKANILALRAGYQVNYPDPQLGGLNGLTLGLGYTFGRALALDYAMVPVGDLGTTHRLSLTFKFDCPKKDKPVAAAPAQRVVGPAENAPIAVPYVAPKPAPKPAPVVLKAILLEDSHFDFDKSELRPEGQAALEDNLQLLKDNPEAKVRVAGYTSMMGTAEYNQALSERRAEAVEAFLVSEGIAPGRITTIGYGQTRPATYEATPGKYDTPAAKSNMRVLFTVTVK